MRSLRSSAQWLEAARPFLANRCATASAGPLESRAAGAGAPTIAAAPKSSAPPAARLGDRRLPAPGRLLRGPAGATGLATGAAPRARARGWSRR